MTLIKSISGIRGTIGGPAGENLTPPDVVKFTTDDKGCPFCHQAIHTMLNMSLGSRIDRGCCLIQDQDRRLGNCRTGNV